MKIDHIGIVVPEITAAIASYAVLGYTVERIEHLTQPDLHCEVALMRGSVNDAGVELICPDNASSRFYGRSGVHHTAFSSGDFVGSCVRFQFAGVVWDGPPMKGFMSRNFRFGTLDGIKIEVLESL